MNRIICLITILAFLTAQGLKAQRPCCDLESSLVGFEVNLGSFDAGSDYNDIDFTNSVGLNFGILADVTLSNSFNLGLHLGYARSEAEGKRNPSIWGIEYFYKAELRDLSLQVRYKFSNDRIIKLKSPFKPSVFLGFGGAIIDNQGHSIDGGNFNNSFALPKLYGGIAIRYKFTETLSIGIQTELQTYFSDKIDGHYQNSKSNKRRDAFSATSLTFEFRPLK
jgi:hypothetical protein